MIADTSLLIFGGPNEVLNFLKEEFKKDYLPFIYKGDIQLNRNNFIEILLWSHRHGTPSQVGSFYVRIDDDPGSELKKMGYFEELLSQDFF